MILGTDSGLQILVEDIVLNSRKPCFYFISNASTALEY